MFHLDFDEVPKAGSRLGTGTMIVLDDHTCPVGMLENLEHFFAQESCGWCTPCWSGLHWCERILGALEAGEGRPQDLQVLEFQTRLNALGHTFCTLAPGAVEPLQWSSPPRTGTFRSRSTRSQRSSRSRESASA